MTEPDLSTLSPERQAAYWRDRAAAFDRLAELDLVANLHPAPAPVSDGQASAPSPEPAGARPRRAAPGAVRAARHAYLQTRQARR